MKCFVFAGMLLCTSIVFAQTTEPQVGMRLLARQFSDYTILLVVCQFQNCSGGLPQTRPLRV